MADDRISQKGTKTRTRAATHGAAIVSDRRCPQCHGRQVLRTQSKNGRQAGACWCGSCGAFFD